MISVEINYLKCNGHTTKLRGMASTLQVRTAISPESGILPGSIAALFGQEASKSISVTRLRGSRKELCVFFSQKRATVMLSQSATSLARY